MFEFDDRGQRIPSAVSRGALEELTGRRHLKAADLLRCFAEARDRIETIALGKLRARSENVSGLLSIWADDLPPGSAPVAVRQGEQLGQP